MSKHSRHQKKARDRARFHTLAKRTLKAARAGNGASRASGGQAYRSVFISDFHLGSRRAKAERLLAFIESVRTENLYLVGDIVDGWRFSKFGHWPESHSEVLDTIFAKAKAGTRVIFIPGNHDHLFRAYLGRKISGISIHHDVVHETADGRRFWVVHGDQFDKTAYVPDWMFHAADLFNRGLHAVNDGYNGVRRHLGMERKCLVGYLKNTSKHGEKFKRNFAKTVAGAAGGKDVDGVICGHIHKPEHRAVAGVTYINTGDWVDSCTALVEHFDGTLEIIHPETENLLRAA